MTRGFVDAGRFKPVFAVEADSGAAATYAANFGAAHLESTEIEHVTEFPEVAVSSNLTARSKANFAKLSRLNTMGSNAGERS